MKKSRGSFLLVIELTAIVLIFAATLAAAGSSRISGYIKTIEYPKKYSEYVEKYAFMYGVDENLIYAVIKAESNFDKDAVSKVGAVGLMQIMPSTYENDIKVRLCLTDGVDSLRDAEFNIKCGVYYLSVLLRLYSMSQVNAVCAYNAGPGNVNSWLEGGIKTDESGIEISAIPFNETRKYASKVVYYADEYEKRYGECVRESCYTDEAEALAYAKKYGYENGVDYNYIMAVIMTESSFDKNALSKSLAMGLMQIKESTYSVDIKANLKLTRDAYDLFDAEFNVMCGAYYIRWLDWYLDGTEQIAAAYHGGINKVRTWLSSDDYSRDGVTLDSIPEGATSRYVDKIMENYGICVGKYGADPINDFNK